MKQNKRNRCGATAVEFALVAPMILLFVFGLMEWGRFEMIRQVSSNAAFSAARLGTLPGTTTSEMEQRATDVLAIYSINVATVSATISGNESSIDIQIPMADNSWFLKRLFGNATIQRDFTLQF